MFHTILILMTGDRWRKSAMVITKIWIINTSHKLESLFVHKFIDTKKSLSTIKNFSCNKLFLEAALDLLFRPSNFDTDLIQIPEWMVVPPIFTADIAVVQSKRTFGFTGSLQ